MAPRTHAQTHFFWVWGSSSGLWDLCCRLVILLLSLLWSLTWYDKKRDWKRLSEISIMRHIYSTWMNVWIFLMFMRHLYWMWQYLWVQELWHNAPEFVSSSSTFVTWYPTQSLSRVTHGTWSRYSSEILNAISIWLLDKFWYWGSLFIFELHLR